MARVLGPLLVVLLTVAAYSPLRTADYVWEDAVYAEMPLRIVDGLQTMRLVTLLTRVGDYELGGGDPWAPHLVNLLLHLLNGALLWIVARRWIGPSAGGVSAAVFLVHPMNSEAVSYITGRSDLLLTLWLLLIAALVTPTMSWWRWLGVIAVSAAALFTKETGVVALLLLLWLRPPSRVAVIAIGLIAGLAVWRSMPWWDWTVSTAIAHGPIGFAAVQVTAVWTYVGLWIWPIGFSIDHDFDVLPRFVPVLALIGTSALAVIAWRGRRAWPVVWLAIGWMTVTLAPRLVVRSPEYLAERQFYLSAVGLALLTGAAWAALDRLVRREAEDFTMKETRWA